jgi:hypothetical protein
MRTTAILLAAFLISCASTVRGPNDSALTLVKPVDQTMAQGETNKITITVARRNFDGKVPIEFSGLPSGVEIVENDREISADDNMRTFTLHAENDARPTSDRVVHVRAEGPSGIATTQTFRLTVRERAAKS